MEHDPRKLVRRTSCSDEGQTDSNSVFDDFGSLPDSEQGWLTPFGRLGLELDDPALPPDLWLEPSCDPELADSEASFVTLGEGEVQPMQQPTQVFSHGDLTSSPSELDTDAGSSDASILGSGTGGVAKEPRENFRWDIPAASATDCLNKIIQEVKDPKSDIRPFVQRFFPRLEIHYVRPGKKSDLKPNPWLVNGPTLFCLDPSASFKPQQKYVHPRKFGFGEMATGNLEFEQGRISYNPKRKRAPVLPEGLATNIRVYRKRSHPQYHLYIPSGFDGNFDVDKQVLQHDQRYEQ